MSSEHGALDKSWDDATRLAAASKEASEPLLAGMIAACLQRFYEMGRSDAALQIAYQNLVRLGWNFSSEDVGKEARKIMDAFDANRRTDG